jgi:hypothetical protein
VAWLIFEKHLVRISTSVSNDKFFEVFISLSKQTSKVPMIHSSLNQPANRASNCDTFTSTSNSELTAYGLLYFHKYDDTMKSKLYLSQF